MTPTFPNDVAHARSRGGSLAMAGAMAAGLMLGRSPMLALVAGLTAAAGLKAVLRQNACAGGSPAGRRGSLKMKPAGAVDCCSGEEKSPEPGFVVPVRAAADQPAWAAEIPLIWEAGQGEPVSCGAGSSQTVWFEMREPMEAVPSVPTLEGAKELPQSFFCEAPAGDLDSLPAVPAIGLGSGDEPGNESTAGPPAGRSGGLAQMVSQMLASGKAGIPEPGAAAIVEEELWQDARRGPHRSVLPQAPVDSGPAARWTMLITAVVLVLVALAMVLGAFQGDRWIGGLKHRWHVARGGPSEQPVGAGDRTMSRPGEK